LEVASFVKGKFEESLPSSSEERNQAKFADTISADKEGPSDSFRCLGAGNC